MILTEKLDFDSSICQSSTFILLNNCLRHLYENVLCIVISYFFNGK